jgi:uncharacterized protein (TIGR00369 family)
MTLKNKQRKIRNPFNGLEGYRCFGCSPTNPIGLKMDFFEEGEEVVSVWEPELDFQGYYNVLHGGIQAALMDEIASWVVYVKLKTAGFTSKAEVRYHHTVYVDQGPVTLRAKSVGMRRNLADIAVELFDARGKKCASGKFIYFTYPEKIAREKMYYPEPEDFYEDQAEDSNASDQ